MRTAEWVSPKHPDKMADRISDAILDAYLQKDPNSRVAVETMGGHGKVYITGEVTSKHKMSHSYIASIIHDIAGPSVILSDMNIVEQSPEIAQGVDTGGAGDQGIMVGYACDENEQMIPQEMYLARSLGKFLYAKYPYDGKTQVTLNNLGEIDTIVASFQNAQKLELSKDIMDWVTFNDLKKEIRIHTNPAGDWNIGGFDADTGLTGRKLAVDNYGPQVNIGGGAFSGKDSTKVDRSGAYMARKIAVDLVSENDIGGVTVKIAYSIGVAQPVMVTAITDDGVTLNVDTDRYDLTPKGIIDYLELRKPIFERLATVGHFGTENKWDYVG